MRTLLFFLIPLLFFSPLQAVARSRPPALVTIQITDQNGVTQTIQTKERLKEFEKVQFLCSQPYQKVVRTFCRNKAGKTRSIITTYWPNGQVQQYLDVVDSVANGRYYEWHENGTVKLQAHIIGGRGDLSPSSVNTWLFEGTASSWDEQGCITAQIPYTKGVLQGTSLYYHPSGSIKKRAPFSEGKLHGIVETFYESGALKKRAAYQNGFCEGESVLFFSSGKKQAAEEYRSGKLWSATYFNNKENVIARVEEGFGMHAVYKEQHISSLEEVREGVQEGSVQLFDEMGKLTNSFSTHQQLKHGPEEVFYPGSSQVQLYIEWYEGSIQGVVRTWYPTGKMESEKEYAQNKKNGLSTAWYEDGTPMLIEEYDNDLLVKGKYYKKGNSSPISYVEEGNGAATLFDANGTLIRKVEYEHGKAMPR